MFDQTIEGQFCSICYLPSAIPTPLPFHSNIIPYILFYLLFKTLEVKYLNIAFSRSLDFVVDV